MSGSLSIPEKTITRAFEKALAKHVASLDVEGLTLLDANAAAKMFGITPQAFREIALEHFDLGSRRTRWSLTDLRAILEKRKVKKGGHAA